MPTAIVNPTGRQIELAYPSAAIDAVPAQRAEEPPADPAEVTRRRYERDLVVALGLFACRPVRVGVLKLGVAFAVKGRDGHADAGRLFAPMVRPGYHAGPVTTKVVMLPQKCDAHTVGFLDRVLLAAVVSPHSQFSVSLPKSIEILRVFLSGSALFQGCFPHSRWNCRHLSRARARMAHKNSPADYRELPDEALFQVLAPPGRRSSTQHHPFLSGDILALPPIQP